MYKSRYCGFRNLSQLYKWNSISDFCTKIFITELFNVVKKRKHPEHSKINQCWCTDKIEKCVCRLKDE